jgi:hypothetical protein
MAIKKYNVKPASFNATPSEGRIRGPGSVEQMKELGQNKPNPDEGNSASANPKGQRIT